jgi:hypothetical protein
MLEACQRFSLDFQATEKWCKLLEEAGFVDINIKWVNWPLGPWAKGDKQKLVGRLALEDFVGVISATTPMLEALGWSTEKAQATLDEVCAEMKGQSLLLYQRVCFCYARKPESV